MNAYELADINDWSCCAHVKEVSAMLRQQADRIAELEDRLSMYEIKDLDKPQIKELSDEEIMNLYKETKADNGGIREFVRAILRKAQE
jgi:hypothetical protein